MCGVPDLSGTNPMLVFGVVWCGGKAEEPRLPVEEEETEEDRWCRAVVQLGSSFTVRWLT